MVHCPDQETLLGFFCGRLTGAELQQVEGHVGGCRACTEALALLGALEIRSTSPRDEDPPEGIGVGTLLGGKYRLVREIGHGAMGFVFEAEHTRLTARYAVKLLGAGVARSSQAFARFEREARLTSALQHPNVVRLFDFDETPGGRAYVVMEYLDGPDLEAHRQARGGRLPPSEVLEIVTQIAAGLQAVHDKGIVHRDLKPPNVVVVRGADGRPAPRLVDFGLAKVAQAALDVTDQPMMVGTPRYMSPEQVQGQAADVGPATDQFALAAIAYELLVGQPLFRGDTLAALTHEIVNEGPPDLASSAPTVPPRWQPALSRALARSPADRFPSVTAFVAALTAPRAARRTARRRPIAAVLLVPLALAVALLVARLVRQPDRHRPTAPAPTATTQPRPPVSGPSQPPGTATGSEGPAPTLTTGVSRGMSEGTGVKPKRRRQRDNPAAEPAQDPTPAGPETPAPEPTSPPAPEPGAGPSGPGLPSPRSTLWGPPPSTKPAP